MIAQPRSLDRAFADFVCEQPIRYLPARRVFRPRGWGRVWPPRLLLEVAWRASRGERVYLTPLQTSRIREMARCLGWMRSPFYVEAAEMAA